MNKNKHPQAPHEKDFTGGMTLAASCSYIGTTGDKQQDKEIIALAEKLATGDRMCMLAEMMVTAVKLCKGNATDGDFKMLNRSLREMQYANEVFASYRDERKVAIFGSARTKPSEAEYKTAVAFAAKMEKVGFMTITGAGPGIMAAGNEGAGVDNSFGLNISLPFETSANEFILNNPKLIDFNYFFTRKLSFVKEADAAVAFPGGVGTMDELFEALTLIQTGKATIYPIVLIDAKGGKYWKFWLQFMEEHLMRLNLISRTDFALFKVTDNVDEAVEEILHFYKNFHSYRYIGDKLVIRMQSKLSDAAVEALNSEFKDIIKDGEIEQCEALKAESHEEDLIDMPRIIFRHKRRDFGRTRQLINAINNAETL